MDSAYRQGETVIFDKDASEIAVVRAKMPSCDIVLCRFHVAKSLYDSVRKYCPKVDQDRMHALCTKMLRCANEEVFWEAFSEVPDGIFKTYLSKNWIPVRKNWANFSTKTMVTWGNKTNNFVERHNRALKSVSNSKTSLAHFFESLLTFHRQQELKMKQKIQELALRSVAIRPKVLRSAAVLSNAHKLLTPYACEQIMLQYNKMKDVVCTYDSEVQVLFVRKSDGEVTEHFVGEGCQCLHFVEKGLPCWHMLAVYESEGVNIVETVPERYQLKKMIDCVMQDTAPKNETGDSAAIGRVSVVSRNTEMAEWQKRLKMKEVCRELVSIGSRCGQEIFERRIHVLRCLIERWRGSEEFEIEDCLEYGDEMTTIVSPCCEGATRQIPGPRQLGRNVSTRDKSIDVSQVCDGDQLADPISSGNEIDCATVREELVRLVGRGEELICLVDAASSEEKNSKLDQVCESVQVSTNVRSELVNLVLRGTDMIDLVDNNHGTVIVSKGGSSQVDHSSEKRCISRENHGSVEERGSSIMDFSHTTINSVEEGSSSSGRVDCCSVEERDNIRVDHSHSSVEDISSKMCQSDAAIQKVEAYGDTFLVYTQKSENCTSAKFAKSKTKGRPKGEGLTFGQKRKKTSNKPSNSKRQKKNDQLCAICLEEEIRKEFCRGGVFMEWVDCDICHKWFHCHCLGLNKSPSDYICDSCNAALMA